MKSLFFCLALFAVLTTYGQSKKYFRKAYQTVYGNFVGVYPLLEKDTVQTNHLTFSYSSNGKLESIESRAAYTGALEFSDFINAEKIGFEYTDSSFTIRDYFTSWNGVSASNQTVEFILDEKGRTIRSVERAFDEELITEYIGTVNYEYKNDQLVALVPEGDFPYSNLYQNASKIELKLHKTGLIAEEIIHYRVEMQYDGVLMNEHYVYEYDTFGNFISSKSYDSEGKMKISSDNCAYTKYAYDKNGYLSGSIMFDTENKRTNYNLTEYVYEGQYDTFVFPCETKIVNDNFGNTCSTAYFMANGNPGADRYGIHEIKSDYNFELRTVVTSNYNLKHELVVGSENYARKFVQRDAKGRIIKEYTFDSDGKMNQNDDGTYIVATTYNDEDNSKVYHFYDQQNQPMVDNSGAHKYVITSDEYGAEIVNAFGINDDYLGQDQASDSYDGLFVRVHYLEDGYTLVTVSYYGYTDKMPALCPEGFFRKAFTYNENGNLTALSYLDTDLKLTNALFGDVTYAEVRYLFNENDYEIESAYYDAEGNRAIDENMISMYRTQYDANDRVIQMDRFGADAALLHKSVSFASVKYRYDNQGLVIEEAYFNEKGGRWSNEVGIASFLYEFDANGLLLKSQWRNVDNKPTVNEEGVFQVVNTYNQDGNVIETRYLNAKGKKMNSAQGAHRIVYSYVSKYENSVIEIFDKKGKHAEADPLGVGFSYTKVIYQVDEEGYNYPIYYKLNGEEINFNDTY